MGAAQDGCIISGCGVFPDLVREDDGVVLVVCVFGGPEADGFVGPVIRGERYIEGKFRSRAPQG